jgi:hypothetical protein
MNQSNSNLTNFDKPIKDTNPVAICSFVCIILAFLSSLLMLLVGPVALVGPLGFALFLILGFLLTIVATVLKMFRREQIRGYLFAILSITLVALFVFFALMVFGQTRDRASRGICRANLEQLYSSIVLYMTAHDGYLPNPDKWCELLMASDKGLSNEAFRCPLMKSGNCNYAFNKNLSGLRLSGIPENTVLLYESNGDWNLAGTAEILRLRHWWGIRGFILLADGTVAVYNMHVDESNILWTP